MSAIETVALARAFGVHQVLTRIDLQVEPGTVFGLVGLNGAGKTTLIRHLLGLLRPDSGTVRMLGRDPWLHESTLFRRTGVVLEHDGFWGTLTFMQNMRVYAGARGVCGRVLEQYLADWWSACELVVSSRKASVFSRGQRMQCALCRAFLDWPAVVLLDEPTVGLDVESYDHFGKLVGEVRKRGSAVLISSHHIETIENLCDRIGLLENGMVREVRRDSAGSETWFVAAAGGAGEVAVILDGLGVAARAVDNGWECRVPGGRDGIPRVVSTLVEHGWMVEEVRPVGGVLREELRRSRENAAKGCS